jgi:hypothetical protein
MDLEKKKIAFIPLIRPEKSAIFVSLGVCRRYPGSGKTLNIA